jgi:ATP-binding cassette, subfamily B, bacterial
MAGRPPQTGGMKSLFRAFAAYLRPYRRYVVLLVLALLVDLAFNAIMPLGFKYLIDDAIPNQDRELLWKVLTVMIVAVVVAGVVAVGRDYLYAKLGTKVMNDLRLRMFEHLQRLSADYYGREHVGDIMARFSSDLASVNNAVVSALPETILGVLGIVFYSILLALLEVHLALIVLVASPLLVLGPRWLGPRAEDESLRVREAEAGIATAVQENVSAQAVIRAYGLAGTQVAAFRRRLEVIDVLHHGRSLSGSRGTDGEPVRQG